MITVTDPTDLSHITHAGIRQLVSFRLQQLASEVEAMSFIVVQPGDNIEQLGDEVGLPILHGLFDDLPFDHPDFSPCFEFMEVHQDEHGNAIYEALYLASDAGVGTAIFVPDQEDIDANLLALCRSFAVPAVSTP